VASKPLKKVASKPLLSLYYVFATAFFEKAVWRQNPLCHFATFLLQLFLKAVFLLQLFLKAVFFQAVFLLQLFLKAVFFQAVFLLQLFFKKL
jgi:hypothetical protein